MRYHFTYLSSFKKDNLRQGDLLKKSGELVDVLKENHLDILKEDYKYFMVLTQSCDLLRREGESCKTEYITIAAVGSFTSLLDKKILGHQKEKFEQIGAICSNARRTLLYQYIEKLFNNNHPEYFYLHNEDELGLSEPCCTFLRLSITIKAKEHYEKCLSAKFLELGEEFKAKLGWLVGNLYSRVGTMDWTPDWITHKEFRSLIDEFLERKLVWVEPELIKAIKNEIKEKGINIDTLDQKGVQKIVESIHIPTQLDKKKKVLNSIKNILEKSNTLKENANLNKLLAKIEQDSVFSGHIK